MTVGKYRDTQPHAGLDPAKATLLYGLPGITLYGGSQIAGDNTIRRLRRRQKYADVG